jgi:type II secretory pathway predicted ATPase ExeA
VYEKFFSLAHRPFAAAPNLECIVAHQGYVDAREKLIRCLSDGCGTAVLTASAGLGKSLLCQEIQSRLRGLFTVAYLCSAQFPNRKAMLQAILFELSAEYLGLSEDEARLGIIRAAQEASERGRSLILIIDEAHLVSTELLQELRGLAEPSPRCANPVRLMLSGQLELEERLADQALDSLNQRIAAHAILEPLTQSESAEYILERLAIAGAKTQIFTEEAMAFIVRAADGNPRAIHQLCDHCLLSAYTIEEKPISLEIARNSLDDLRALPLHWNDAGLLDDAPEADDESLDDASDDEFVPTVSTEVCDDVEGELSSETASEAEAYDPGPLWSDSPNFGVIEVGGQAEAQARPVEPAEVREADEVPPHVDSPEPPDSSEAALFASIAPWPAVPVESIGIAFDESMSAEVVESESIPFSMPSTEVEAVEEASVVSSPEIAASEFEATTESIIEEETLESEESLSDGDDEEGFTLRDPNAIDSDSDDHDESAEDTAIEKVWSQQLELLDDLEADDFEDEEIIINDHYAALDRATEALSSHLPQAPELLQFLSQYSVKDEPRRAREAASMHQSAVEVAEPEIDTTEEELLATIRGLQEQLRQATIERHPPQESWQESLDPVYDVVEPPEQPAAAAPVIEPVIEESQVADEGPIAKPAEPVKSRFAQLFSRMRQRRREVEDRLRKNADWI